MLLTTLTAWIYLIFYSINRRTRQYELLKITQENQAILKRIQSRKPFLDTVEMKVDYMKSRQYIDSITRFPPITRGSRRRSSGSKASSDTVVPLSPTDPAPLGVETTDFSEAIADADADANANASAPAPATDEDDEGDGAPGAAQPEAGTEEAASWTERRERTLPKPMGERTKNSAYFYIDRLFKTSRCIANNFIFFLCFLCESSNGSKILEPGSAKSVAHIFILIRSSARNLPAPFSLREI